MVSRNEHALLSRDCALQDRNEVTQAQHSSVLGLVQYSLEESQ